LIFVFVALTNQKQHQSLYLTIGALIGLLIGFALGLWNNQTQSFIKIVSWSELFGKVWLCALITLAVPLVSAYLYHVVSSVAKGRVAGKIGLHALWFHLIIMAVGMAFTLSMSYGFSEVITGGIVIAKDDIIPTHVELSFEAPALILYVDFAQTFMAKLILPMLIIVVLVGMVLSRFFPAQNLNVLRASTMVSEKSFRAMTVLIFIMPFAAFALSFALASTSGYTLAGVIGRYVLVLIIMLFVFTLVLYVIAAFFGQVPLFRFARALLPAQLVAASTRSSLATMPVLMTQAEMAAGIPVAVTGLVIPFSISVFRLNRAISSIFSYVFLTAIYNIPTDFWSTVLFLLLIMVLSFGSPGVPSGGKLATMPVFLALGVPLEMVILLKAIDAVPDVFKTVLNVTEVMTIASMVTRSNAMEIQPLTIDGHA